ncbi:hypothetical protein BDV23DRAFT_94316 [Aspergillus alliaceus]|uniref:Uncharacterized protein n=1 Tax=Petromyces alliaceus TaxID=209559 RepID=A0A5N7C6I0_PETAA|nr:hypothetical protein BDV23DRAFT_94316 [Aspergillus alliaceus]
MAWISEVSSVDSFRPPSIPYHRLDIVSLIVPNLYPSHTVPCLMGISSYVVYCTSSYHLTESEVEKGTLKTISIASADSIYTRSSRSMIPPPISKYKIKSPGMILLQQQGKRTSLLICTTCNEFCWSSLSYPRKVGKWSSSLPICLHTIDLCWILTKFERAVSLTPYTTFYIWNTSIENFILQRL